MEVRWRAALERPVELRWNYQLLALICLDFQFALLARFPRPLFVSYILTFL